MNPNYQKIILKLGLIHLLASSPPDPLASPPLVLLAALVTCEHYLVNRSSKKDWRVFHLSAVLRSSRTWERGSRPFSLTVARVWSVQAALTPWKD